MTFSALVLVGGLTFGGEGQNRNAVLENLQAEVRELKLLLQRQREERKLEMKVLEEKFRELVVIVNQPAPALKEGAKLLEAMRLLQAENEVLRAKLRAAQTEAVLTRDREESLRVRLDHMERELRRATALLAQGEGKTVVGALPGPNPPARKLDGRILEVRDGLVRIDLGKDHGLEKGHTLEAYRLEPQPSYLGMIRILEVDAAQSVGRFEGRVQGKAKTGDRVSPRLLP